MHGIEIAPIGDAGQTIEMRQAFEFTVGRSRVRFDTLNQAPAHLVDTLHGAHLGVQHHIADGLDQIVVAAGLDAAFEIG